MQTFTYSKIPMSIEDTPFSYVVNIDDYRTMAHIIDIIVQEKITNDLMRGVFNNIKKVFRETIGQLSKMLKDETTIDQTKLERYMRSANRSIILVNNAEYMSFASYGKDFEADESLFTFASPKCVLFNVGQLEATGSISVVPSNANVFLSSLLYAYVLSLSNELYNRLNVDVLVQITKIYYTVMLNSFGRKSGLFVSERRKKETRFFLTACFVHSIYVPKNKAMTNIKDFLSYASANTGSMYLQEFFHKIINATEDSAKDVWSGSTYNSIEKFCNLAKRLDLLEVGETEVKIQWFKTLGNYGVMALENYPRLVAYICATYIPNTYMTSTLKIYNKAAYEYLLEYFIRDIHSVRV